MKYTIDAVFSKQGQSLRRMLGVGVLAVAALAGTSQPAASSSLALSITDSTTIVACDNAFALVGTNCTAIAWVVTPNSVSFSGNVGFLATTGSAATTAASTMSQAQLDLTNLVLMNTDTAVHTLTIDATGFGFTLPPNPSAASSMTLRGSQSLTSSSSGGTTTATSFADGTNAIGSDANANVPCTLSVSASASCNESSITWVRDAGPFSLRTMLTVVLNGGESISLNETTAATATDTVTTTAVPEPASLLLLGTGLLVAGSKLRRNFAQA